MEVLRHIHEAEIGDWDHGCPTEESIVRDASEVLEVLSIWVPARVFLGHNGENSST